MPLTPLKRTASVLFALAELPQQRFQAKEAKEGSTHAGGTQAHIGVSIRGAYVVEEGGADVIQVSQQSEKAAAQFVIPHLSNTKAAQ